MTQRFPSNALIAAFVLAAPAAAAETAVTPAPLAGMDRAAVPGEDFYGFANGAWLRDTPIPADRGSYGAGAVAFDITNTRTVELIQAATGAAGSDTRKVARLLRELHGRGRRSRPRA